jgi:hypothetical protein
MIFLNLLFMDIYIIRAKLYIFLELLIKSKINY